MKKMFSRFVATAMTLAMDNNMVLVCFALKDPKNILRVICGENVGTIVKC